MYSDGFSHTDEYNKDGIVHYIFQWVIGRTFQIIIFFNVFILDNSADPDEMPHFVAFHLGLHCLPKSTFRGF